MLAAVVLLAGFAWFAFRSVQPDVMELSYPRKYKSIVTEQAAEYDLEESLVYAVIKAESNFDAEAVSSVGAVGLMQMMPETFYWMQTHVGETYDESADADDAGDILLDADARGRDVRRIGAV